MKPLIETLNLWGGNALQLVWPVLWQSSLLIGLLFGLDLVLRRRVRAAVRYALWLVVLVKLLLPPALAFPTGLGWWLRPVAHLPAKPASGSVVVTYDADNVPGPTVPAPVMDPPPPRVALSAAAAALVGSATVSLGLLIWMLVRWRRLARDVGNAAVAPAGLQELLAAGGRLLGLRRAVQLRLTERPMSPAVCGLVKPVILLPRSLPEQLEPSQLRAVLLHELIHLRRGDVWVNCVQALLQMVYWWHPLLWVANARIRQAREEAVDDAVMLALRGEASAYPPTLLEVAKLALRRRMPSLGLVGILESRHSLRRRIQRLLDFHPPRRTGLTLVSVLGVLAFAAIAVPMGQAPEKRERTNEAAPDTVTMSPATFKEMSGAVVRENDANLASLSNILSDPQFRMVLAALGTDPDAAARNKARESSVSPVGPVSAREERHALGFDWYLGNLLTNAGSAPPESPVNPTNLFTRRFRIDANKLLSAMGITGGLPLEEHLPVVTATREWFKAKGVDLSQPKSLFFNETRNYLFVRATIEDLDLIERAIQQAQSPASPEGVIRDPSGNPYRVTFDANGGGSQSSKGTPIASTNLFTRTFRIDYAKLREALGPAGGQLLEEPHASVSEALRNLFTENGVELSPPKTLFCSLGLGHLFVRATTEDLHVIARLVEPFQRPASTDILPRSFKVDTNTFMARVRSALGRSATSPPDFSTPEQVLGALLQARGLEFKQVTLDERRGQLWVYATKEQADAIAAQPELQGTSAATPSSSAESARPQINIKATLLELPEAEAAAFRTRFPVTNTPGAGNWEVLLSAAQAAEELAQWKAGQGDILSSPQILTLSGRRAEIFIGETLPVLVRTNSTTATNQVETGIRLGVVPTVSADGWTVGMDVTTSLTEFTGYAKGTNGENCPVPQFRMVKMATHASVPDHQALVLGGPVSEKISTIEEKTPVLGDIPLLGGLFRSKTSSTRRSCLFVLLTPTLVDDKGNAVHAR